LWLDSELHAIAVEGLSPTDQARASEAKGSDLEAKGSDLHIDKAYASLETFTAISFLEEKRKKEEGKGKK
jgi:hypothetical protein